MSVLIAIDDSAYAVRVLRYAGEFLRQAPEIPVTVFHVLKPLPRKLLEHGGSENPEVEEQLSESLRQEQETWQRQEQEVESPVLARAREVLAATGLETSRVTLKFGYQDDVAANILDEARKGNYKTIVVGRQGQSGIKRLIGGGVTDHLLREATGLTLWIVE